MRLNPGSWIAPRENVFLGEMMSTKSEGEVGSAHTFNTVSLLDSLEQR